MGFSLKTIRREPDRIVIGLRNQRLIISIVVLVIVLAAVAASMAAGESFSASSGKLFMIAFIVVLIVGIIMGFRKRHMIIDLAERNFKLGKRNIPFEMIQAVCLFTRIRTRRNRSSTGSHDRVERYIQWNVVLVLGWPRGGAESVGLARRSLDKVLQMGGREHPPEERDRAAALLGDKWIATDTEISPVSSGTGTSFLWRLAELLAGNTDALLIDLSGDRISIRTPEELDTPLIERIGHGQVTVEDPGPKPSGIEAQTAGHLLQLSWNPARFSHRKIANFIGVVFVTVFGVVIAVWVAPFFQKAIALPIRFGAIGLVLLMWASMFLRHSLLELGPTEIVYRTRFIFPRVRKLPLGALEEIRANPLLEPQLELVCDQCLVQVPLNRATAGWFRGRLVSHLAGMATAGVQPPPVPEKFTCGGKNWLVLIFVVGFIGAVAGLIVYQISGTAEGGSAGQPTTSSVEQVTRADESGEEAGVVTGKYDPATRTFIKDTDGSPPDTDGVEELSEGIETNATATAGEDDNDELAGSSYAGEDELQEIASLLHGRWRLSCKNIDGPRARKLRRRKRHRLMASLEATLKISPDGTFKRSSRRRRRRRSVNHKSGKWRVAEGGAHLVLTTRTRKSIRETRYELFEVSDESFKLALVQKDLRFELEASEIKPPWTKLGEYASVPARSNRVNIELNRRQDRLQIRGKAMEGGKVMASDRCRFSSCVVKVLLYGAPNLDKAFSTRRALISLKAEERYGRFDVSIGYQKLCRRKPRFIAISLEGKGEIGARVGGDRVVVEAGAGLCFGKSDLKPPGENERKW